MKKRLFSMILVLCLSLCVLSVSAWAAQEKGTEDAVIFYTNDVHTYIDGEIRYSHIAALKASYSNALLLDAGDHIQGTAYGSMDKGKTIVELMNAAGYDAATLGNHEFDYGMSGCLQTVEQAAYPYLSCNFRHEKDGEAGEAGESVLDAYKVFEVGSVKIAVIGITTPETFTSSTPAYFQDEDGNYIYGIAGGEDGQELYDAVQRAIDAASKEADIIIGLGHLGDDLSSMPWRSEDVIANTTGLDAFIDGHSHSTVPMQEVSDLNGDTVILTQTGEYLGAVGKMTISGGKIKTELLTKEDFAAITPNADVKAIEDRWIAEMKEKLGQQIGQTQVTLDNYDAEGNRLVRSQETNTGDFAADALYYLFDNMGMDVDVAIMNSGGIRNKAITGTLTYETCKQIHTFGNVACLQTVTGQQILDALEWGARGVGVEEQGGFLQVSGLTYQIDTTIPNTIETDDKGVWAGGPIDRYRVHDVKIYNKETDSWEDLDREKSYNLAGYNYTLRDLGDGYAMFEGAENVLDYVMEDYLVLANYIQGFEGGTVGAANSPLKAKYPSLLMDYSAVNGSGRILLAERKPNTLHYDANGGEGAPESSARNDVFMSIADGKPTREGYFFTGWNSEQSGSGADYRPGDLYAFTYDDGNGGCNETVYARWLQLYVGGVWVTTDNAADVLGDGTVSFDLETNTLILKNANITSSFVYEEGCVAAILAEGDLKIRLEGKNSVTAGHASISSSGIYAMGDLTISGEGELTVVAGDVSGVANSENRTLDCSAIYVSDVLTISQAKIVAISGNVTVTAKEGYNGPSRAYSEAIVGYDGLYINDGAVVQATAGKAVAQIAFSCAMTTETDLQIQNATVKAVAGEAVGTTHYATSVGIYACGELWVLEGGSVEAVAGKSSSVSSNSHGIQVFGPYAVIDGGKVTATGGEAVGVLTEDATESYANSAGIYTQGTLDVQNNGSLIVSGGRAEATQAYSEGIFANDEVGIYDGYLKADGALAEGSVRAESIGVYVNKSTFCVYDKSAVVLISSGSAKSDVKAFSNALYVSGGSVWIEGGTVSITSDCWEAPKGDGYAVYVTAYEEDGCVSGGDVNFACYDIVVNPNGYGFLGTQITISAPYGHAIYGQCNIALEEMLAITSGEGSQIAQLEETNPDTAADMYYTFVDAAGQPLQNVSIELLTYKVKVENNTSYGQGILVPADWSINEAYCEKFGAEDMAEILHGEREGFLFGGFYTDEDCTQGNEYDFWTPVTEDMTIYAKWITVYSPVVEKTEGGETTIDVQTALEGEAVTITAKPEAGWEVDTVTVTDQQGNPVAVTKNQEGTYSYFQPRSETTVKVTYREASKGNDEPGNVTGPTPADQTQKESGNAVLWIVLILIGGGVIAVTVYFVRKRKA